MVFTTLLIFYGSVITLFLIGYYVFSIFYNRESEIQIAKLLAQAEELKPVVIKNMKLRYWKTYSMRMRIYPYSTCDLYLFDNCLAVIRRQHLIFKVIYPPEFIAADPSTIYNTLGHYEVFKPVRVIFNRFVKGQVDIKLADFSNNSIVVDITLKDLTEEQRQQLEKIKNWIS